jgi:hypothetical protein
MDWQANILETDSRIAQLLGEMRSVAVLGIKPETHADQAAHYVPAYLASAGLEVIPVPVYYPEVTEILGKGVFRKLADIQRPIDVVNVFRRSQDVPTHLDDLVAARPKAVWMQSGIRHDAVAEKLAREGILVVQDRCLMVEHRRARVRSSRRSPEHP